MYESTVRGVACSLLVTFVLLVPSYAGPGSLLNGLASGSTQMARQRARDQLLELGPSVIGVLRKGVRSPDESVRYESIRLLGDLQARDAVPELLACLRERRDARSVLVTSYALGQIRDGRALPELMRAASPQEGDIAARRGAIVALGLLGDCRAVPILTDVLSEDNELLKVFAAGSLGLLNSDSGLDAAIAACESNDDSTRRHAVQAIGLIGSKRGGMVLQRVLERHPLMVERQYIELSQFQISIHGWPEVRRLSALRTTILEASADSLITRWCIEQLGRTKAKNAKGILDEISRQHPLQAVRQHAASRCRIRGIVERSLKGNNDED